MSRIRSFQFRSTIVIVCTFRHKKLHGILRTQFAYWDSTQVVKLRSNPTQAISCRISQCKKMPLWNFSASKCWNFRTSGTWKDTTVVKIVQWELFFFVGCHCGILVHLSFSDFSVPHRVGFYASDFWSVDHFLSLIISKIENQKAHQKVTEVRNLIL